MDQELYLVFFFHIIVAQDVINMAMGIKQVFNGQLICRYEIIQLLAFRSLVTAGVDDDCFPGFVKGHNRIFLKGVKNKGLNRHPASWILAKVQRFTNSPADR
jgi:hypothetical protein